MSRLLRPFRIAIDVGVISVAFWLAYLFRFEFQIPSAIMDGALFYWACIATLQYAGLAAFGVPRMSWRYLNMRDAVYVLIAVAVPTAIVIALRLFHLFPLPRGGVLPLGVVAMDFVLVFLGLVGVRASRRLWGSSRIARSARWRGPVIECC